MERTDGSEAPMRVTNLSLRTRKKAYVAGAQRQLEKWYKMKLDRTKPRSFRHR